MCVESSEWMKLGGKPFFCFSVLGFLGASRVHSQDSEPGHSLGPAHPYPGGLLHVCPCPHSLVGVHAAAEREALEPAFYLQGWHGDTEVESCPAQWGWAWGTARTMTLESRW